MGFGNLRTYMQPKANKSMLHKPLRGLDGFQTTRTPILVEKESVNNSVYLLLVKRDLIIAFQKQS